jgi:hypothetical protein
MMSPATTLLQCWTTLRRFSGPVQDKEEEEGLFASSGKRHSICQFVEMIVLVRKSHKVLSQT